MNSNPHPFNGLLLVDKPRGPSSHDVVDRVRRKLGMRRIGHAGTLDPNATGLLIILVGKATKVSQYLISLDKFYEGVIKLGEETDSHDSEGNIMAEISVPDLSEEQILEFMNEFVGDQYQTPPMFSAKKIKGVPLYKLARKGKVVEREARFIRVSSMKLLKFEPPFLSFSIHCSKGAYVRTIAHDMGGKIGCGAHLTELRRTAIDKFLLADAVSLEDFENFSVREIQRSLLPVYQAIPSNVL